MPAIGGSPVECSLRGRILIPTADCDPKITLGGASNERKPNGNGTSRLIKSTEAGGVEGLKVEIDHIKDDATFLQEIADSDDYVDFSITLKDGSTWGGRATIEEMPGFNPKDASAELKIVAESKLAKQ
jgi:hypothetical protein